MHLLQAQRKTDKAKNQQEVGNLHTRLLGTTRRLVYATDQLALSKDTVQERNAYINRLECQLVQVHRAKADHAKRAKDSASRSASRSTADVQVQCDLLQGAVGASAASSLQRDSLRQVASRLGVCDLLDSVNEGVHGHFEDASPAQSADTQPTTTIAAQRRARSRASATARYGGYRRPAASSTPPPRGRPAFGDLHGIEHAANSQGIGVPQHSASPAVQCKRWASAASRRAANRNAARGDRAPVADASTASLDAHAHEHPPSTPLFSPADSTDGAGPGTAVRTPRDVYADPDTVANSGVWVEAGARSESDVAASTDLRAGMSIRFALNHVWERLCMCSVRIIIAHGLSDCATRYLQARRIAGSAAQIRADHSVSTCAWGSYMDTISSIEARILALDPSLAKLDAHAQDPVAPAATETDERLQDRQTLDARQPGARARESPGLESDDALLYAHAAQQPWLNVSHADDSDAVRPDVRLQSRQQRGAERVGPARARAHAPALRPGREERTLQMVTPSGAHLETRRSLLRRHGWGSAQGGGVGGKARLPERLGTARPATVRAMHLDLS